MMPWPSHWRSSRLFAALALLYASASAWTLCSEEATHAPPDLQVARIIDDVAAQFVAANARGMQGHEPPALKLAARAYKAKVSSLPMPWQDYARNLTPPPAPEPLIPNIIHWAWRSGDADWTLALSVAMAKIVQKPTQLLIHTGPLDAITKTTYTTPTTEAGTEALQCLAACGATEIQHRKEPAPGNKHPWSEVLKPHTKLSKQTFAHISDVMRLYTIIIYGGIYLDRDAFLHLPVDHYRYRYSAVLGLDPETYEGDHDVNFGAFMAAQNSTFFRLLWDGCGIPHYRNLSYAVTWGGWAHDSCRKSFALAIKRPDLVHVDEHLYQFPFPGKSAARGRRGHTPPALLEKTATHEILHMSGFEWNKVRTVQLQAKPSIFGGIVWPNVLRAALEKWQPDELQPELVSCLSWLQNKLKSRGYIPENFEFPPQLASIRRRRLR